MLQVYTYQASSTPTPRSTLTPDDRVAGVPTRQVLHVPGF